MSQQDVDSINLWFLAAEELGEYIGIRFGQIPPGATEPNGLFCVIPISTGLAVWRIFSGKRGAPSAGCRKSGIRRSHRCVRF